MKLIIDIDKEMISLIKDKSVECFNIIHYGQVLDAIYNGTPILDNATVCDIEQIRAEIEHEADYQDAYVDADVVKGMYMALDIINKYTK